MKRADYIGAPQKFNLNHACRVLVDAFGPCVYLVGSSLERRDFRDVDVRCILSDAEFDRMFPGAHPYSSQLHAGWSVICSALSLWLSEHSRLPVDFQFQRQTKANAEENGTRSALGLFIDAYREPTPSQTASEPLVGEGRHGDESLAKAKASPPVAPPSGTPRASRSSQEGT